MKNLKFMKKVVALVLSISFLAVNNVYGIGGDNLNLAPLTKFDRMQNMEFKEAAELRIGIQAALKGLVTQDTLTLDALKALGVRTISEKTVFSSQVVGRIDFENSVLENGSSLGNAVLDIGEDSYVVIAQVNNELYYALISRDRGEDGFKVTTVPARVLKELMTKKGTIKFKHDSINELDRRIIEDYIDHEITTRNGEAIDPWIQRKIQGQEYAVDDRTASTNPRLYGHPKKKIYKRGDFNDVRARVELFLLDMVGALNSKSADAANKIARIENIIDQLSLIPLVLIPYTPGEKLPTKLIGREEVRVTGHSSAHATYIFVPQKLYASVDAERGWSPELSEYVERIFVREIGARCGLKVRVTEDGKVQNALDEIYALALARPNRFLTDQDKAKIPHELMELELKNLLQLELRNDYAYGNLERAKGIFQRVLTVFATAVLSAAGCKVADVSSQPPAPIPTPSVAQVSPSPIAESPVPTPQISPSVVDTDWLVSPNEGAIKVDISKVKVSLQKDILTVEMVSFRAPVTVSINLKDKKVERLDPGQSSPTVYAPGEEWYARSVKQVIRALDEVLGWDTVPALTKSSISHYPNFLRVFLLESAAPTRDTGIVPVGGNYDSFPRVPGIVRFFGTDNSFTYEDRGLRDSSRMPFKNVTVDLDTGTIYEYIPDEAVPRHVTAYRVLDGAPYNDKKGYVAGKLSEILGWPRVPEDVKAVVRYYLDRISESGNVVSAAGVASVLVAASTGELLREAAKGMLRTLGVPKETITTLLDESDDIAFGFGVFGERYKSPGEKDIKAIAARIKALGIEVYIPREQLPDDRSVSDFRKVASAVLGSNLRPYDGGIDGLLELGIKNPEKAIVMTTDLTDDQRGKLEALGDKVRVMNFEGINVAALDQAQYDNYLAETLATLLLARTITKEEAIAKSGATYTMLAHLLEMPLRGSGVDVESYIKKITSDSITERLATIIKAILKTRPPEAYTIIREAVRVLWSA